MDVTMRLDKFLKISRIIKRRAVAKEAAEKGRIQINGTIAKPSANVKIGDELTIQFGTKIITAKVERLDTSTKKRRCRKKCTRSLANP